MSFYTFENNNKYYILILKKKLQEFQSVVYKATERRELLSAINEILNFSIVMPPGDYDKEDLLPSHAHIKETTAEIRRRQSRMYPPSQPRKSNTYNNLYKSCTPGTSLENGHCKEKT